MRLLLVHNYYQFPGGEDQVFASETELLERHGHLVSHYTAHNDQVGALGPLALGGKTLWNVAAHREMRELCRALRPEVVHFHNTFPLISPSAYYAARREGAAVVQTLHNYRLLCPGTTFYREGRLCEDCLGHRVPWAGVVHRCYRGSRGASAGVAALVASHRLAGTWNRAVDLYVAPTDFLRRKFVEGGMAASKVVTKPHFLPDDPGVGEHGGGYALYVGRLTGEKGIPRLRDAWIEAGLTMPLKIAGDGPLAPLLREAPDPIEWLGHRSREEIVALMKNAEFLIFPSEWYEAFGLTIIEAFATGLPVIASRLGAAADLVDPGRTGLHFQPGDAADLATAVRWAADHPREMGAMGRAARAEYLQRYTPECNYPMLMDVYERAILARGGQAEVLRAPRRRANKRSRALS